MIIITQEEIKHHSNSTVIVSLQLEYLPITFCDLRITLYIQSAYDINQDGTCTVAWLSSISKLWVWSRSVVVKREIP